MRGQLSPSWALLIGKGHLGPSPCPRFSQGSLSLVGSGASGEPRERGWAEPNWAQGGIQTLNLQNKQTNKQKILLLLCNKNPWFVYPQPSSLLALPAFEDVPCVPMNNLQTYNTKGMKTDNAIYFALMSSRQW